ncbi:MAG: ABC transporter, substrate-binding protein (cluster 1, maltose/g3p/polyamine/iron), partial [uncultured Thermomicrobiales bacterium]
GSRSRSRQTAGEHGQPTPLRPGRRGARRRRRPRRQRAEGGPRRRARAPVLEPVRRRRRRSPPGDAGRVQRREPRHRPERGHLRVGAALLHQAGDVGRRWPTARGRGAPCLAPALLRPGRPARAARPRRPDPVRHRSRQVPAGGLGGDAVRGAALRHSPRYPSLHHVLQHRRLPAGRAARPRRDTAPAPGAGRGDRRLPPRPGGDRQPRPRLRDQRRRPLAPLLRPLRPARRHHPLPRRGTADHRRRQGRAGPQLHGRPDGREQGRVPEPGRPRLGRHVQQRQRRLPPERGVGGHHLRDRGHPVQRGAIPQRLRHQPDLGRFPRLRPAEAAGRRPGSARRLAAVHQLHAQGQPDLGPGRAHPLVPPRGHRPRVRGAGTPVQLRGGGRDARLRPPGLVQRRRRPAPGRGGGRLRRRPERAEEPAGRHLPVPSGDGGPARHAGADL